MTLTEHIYELADEFGVTPIFHASRRTAGFALPMPASTYKWTVWHTRKCNGYPNAKVARGFKKNTIIIPRPWYGPDAYWTCLHEIAHCVLRHTPYPYGIDSLKCEMDAWSWALENSIYPLSRTMLNRIYNNYLGNHPIADRDKRIDKWYERSEVYL